MWILSINIFFVILGPATTSRGNQGLGPDGTAMYINGILAPDMTLQRGKEYTFVVETGLGSDPDQTFHPLYITSDPIGNIQNCNVMEQSSSKGQLISKGLFDILNSSKKRMKKFNSTTMIPQVDLFSFVFWKN